MVDRGGQQFFADGQIGLKETTCSNAYIVAHDIDGAVMEYAAYIAAVAALVAVSHVRFSTDWVCFAFSNGHCERVHALPLITHSRLTSALRPTTIAHGTFSEGAIWNVLALVSTNFTIPP